MTSVFYRYLLGREENQGVLFQFNAGKNGKKCIEIDFQGKIDFQIGCDDHFIKGIKKRISR